MLPWEVAFSEHVKCSYVQWTWLLVKTKMFVLKWKENDASFFFLLWCVCVVAGQWKAHAHGCAAVYDTAFVGLAHGLHVICLCGLSIGWLHMSYLILYYALFR